MSQATSAHMGHEGATIFPGRLALYCSNKADFSKFWRIIQGLFSPKGAEATLVSLLPPKEKCISILFPTFKL